MTANILIADSQEIVRIGVRALVNTRPDMTVIGEAADGEEAIQKIVELRPDIYVIDLAMPKIDGLEVIRRINQIRVPSVPVVLSPQQSEALARAAITAGAKGFVLKSDPARDLLTAIEAVRQQRLFLTSSLASMVLMQLCERPDRDRGTRLTPRELEALRLLAEGMSNKEIASTLKLSIRTVETHRAHIMAKLGLHSIGELVHYAIRNKIVAA